MKPSGLWKKMAVLMLALSGVGASAGAWATDYTFNVGTLVSGTPYTQVVNHVLPAEPVGTTFMDIFNFQIGSVTGASSIAVNLNLVPFLNIDNLQLGLYSEQNALWSGLVGSGVTLSSYLLTNTNYYLKITGTTSGTLGGAYTTAISAVPEAESWAMMLAGLGLVGFALRRNNRRQV
ncbi:MAG: PEP-CTERM sorting domain-containing protein [Hydrogenophilales bacterium]|nr:PEP-CTERM sorting domain-containing protein [Hydrogenophilales bacterium]